MKKTTLEMFKEIEDLEVAPDNDGEPLKSVKDIVPNWCNKIEQSLTKFEKIKTIMDTWNTSGTMSDEKALSQIDEVLRNE